MHHLHRLFENNRTWAAQVTRSDPSFFPELAKVQQPAYLWIGCSDSRVPPNEILGLHPGELFVHRNIANIITPTDTNCLAVLQYAVAALGIGHVIICGHYGCGGVTAALDGHATGVVADWLRPLGELYERRRAEVDALPTPRERSDRLSELNVIEQVRNAANTATVRDAWHSGRTVHIHGCMFSLADGMVRDLDVTVSSPDDLTRPDIP